MSKTLTQAMLVENLCRSNNVSKKDAKIIVESFFKTIFQHLVNGERVKLSGFGNFILRDKKSRPGRNPKTGKDAVISARRVVTFRAGQKLKSRVAKYGKTQNNLVA